MIIYREQLGRGVDNVSRAGESETVSQTRKRCRACGGRIQEIRDNDGQVVARVCRGCGRRVGNER